MLNHGFPNHPWVRSHNPLIENPRFTTVGYAQHPKPATSKPIPNGWLAVGTPGKLWFNSTQVFKFQLLGAKSLNRKREPRGRIHTTH